jgi:hypothetical protein
MTDRLDIPAEAFRVKADYFDRPPRALVAVIKEFIERFGTPHLWSGHTHAKPPKGCRVTFLAKYSLPKTHRRPRSRWAPCPCCSPHHPKYFKYGLIAWFPDEGVIRCVGDKCYKKMDPDGYELAMNQLNAEIEAERTANYLLARIPRIPEYLRVLNGNVPALAAIDDMLNRLNKMLTKTFNIDLWPEVNTGVLRYIVTRNEVQRSREGDLVDRTVSDFEDYGPVAGYVALKPSTSRFAKRVQQKMDNLDTINFGPDPLERIMAMTETEKQATVKILSWVHRETSRICQQAVEARSFFTPATLATINGWSEQDTVAYRVHFAMDAEGFHVARDANQNHSLIRWPENFWKNIQELEPLSQPSAA